MTVSQGILLIEDQEFIILIMVRESKSHSNERRRETRDISSLLCQLCVLSCSRQLHVSVVVVVARPAPRGAAAKRKKREASRRIPG
jgi:hypothetical protein